MSLTKMHRSTIWKSVGRVLRCCVGPVARLEECSPDAKWEFSDAGESDATSALRSPDDRDVSDQVVYFSECSG